MTREVFGVTNENEGGGAEITDRVVDDGEDTLCLLFPLWDC